MSPAIRSLGVVLLLAAIVSKPPLHAAAVAPLKMAVFDFELEDVSAAGAAAMGEPARDSTRMQVVTDEARRVLAQSGRYRLVDTGGVDAEPVKQKSLRNCDGCEAGIALKFGAERSF